MPRHSDACTSLYVGSTAVHSSRSKVATAVIGVAYANLAEQHARVHA